MTCARRAARAVVAVVALVGGAVTSAAARPMPDPCAAAHGQRALNRCVSRRATDADSALERTYARALATVDSARRPAFEAAQRAWREYRDAYCEYVAPVAARASMAPMARGLCRLRITATREHELRADARLEPATGGGAPRP